MSVTPSHWFTKPSAAAPLSATLLGGESFPSTLPRKLLPDLSGGGFDGVTADVSAAA